MRRVEEGGEGRGKMGDLHWSWARIRVRVRFRFRFRVEHDDSG